MESQSDRSDRSDRIMISRQGAARIVEFTDSKLLDEVEISRIGEELAALVASEDKPQLVLDFSNVVHMSSSALGMLIMLHKQVRQREGRMALCSIRPEIYKVFSITKLSGVFQIYDSRTTAIAGVG